MRAPRGPDRVVHDRACQAKTVPGGRAPRNSVGSADLIPPSGILGRANARNRNGRVYPKHLLQREASVFYSAHVRMCRALGELDHPPPASPTFRSLNLANVSHQVLDYHWQGDDLMGYVEVLPTHAGTMLRDLYVAGNRLGMSSRGWATLSEKDGYVYIQEDFELITFDFVSDPSTDGAYLRPVQRKFEGLKKQIDIKAAYDSFMAQCAGKAIIKATAPAMPVMRTGGVAGAAPDASLAPTLVACERNGETSAMDMHTNGPGVVPVVEVPAEKTKGGKKKAKGSPVRERQREGNDGERDRTLWQRFWYGGPRRWGKVVPSPATTSLKYQWDIVQQMRMDPKLGPVITSPRTRSKPKIIAAPF